MNKSFRIASLMAVITYACIGSQAVQAQGFLNKLENAVQDGVDRRYVMPLAARPAAGDGIASLVMP